MSQMPFPDAAPNSHSVAFKMPFSATPSELKEWFDSRIKHKWRVAYGGHGIDMSVVPPHRRGSWRLPLARWEELMQVVEPFHDGTYYDVVVNFDDPKDAMLFKLTWG